MRTCVENSFLAGCIFLCFDSGAAFYFTTVERETRFESTLRYPVRRAAIGGHVRVRMGTRGMRGHTGGETQCHTKELDIFICHGRRLHFAMHFLQRERGERHDFNLSIIDIYTRR